MFPYVVFDLDGTLLDTLQDLAAAGNHALSAMGLPVHPTDAYRTMVGNGIPKLIERMLPDGNCGKATQEVALQLFAGYYQHHNMDLTAPYPGIMKMLENLSKAGVGMGIASNKQHAFTKKLAEHFFPGTFSAVLGLREGCAAKPDPAFLLELMAEMGAGVHNTLYVGDSDVDMITARNAGLTPCGVLWGFRSRQELLENGAKLLAESPEQLEDFILNS